MQHKLLTTDCNTDKNRVDDYIMLLVHLTSVAFTGVVSSFYYKGFVLMGLFIMASSFSTRKDLAYGIGFAY